MYQSESEGRECQNPRVNILCTQVKLAKVTSDYSNEFRCMTMCITLAICSMVDEHPVATGQYCNNFIFVYTFQRTFTYCNMEYNICFAPSYNALDIMYDKTFSTAKSSNNMKGHKPCLVRILLGGYLLTTEYAINFTVWHALLHSIIFKCQWYTDTKGKSMSCQLRWEELSRDGRR